MGSIKLPICQVKIRSRYNLIKSEVLYKCIENNDIVVSFSFLPNLPINLNFFTTRALNFFSSFSNIKLKPKIISQKKIYKVIFFPHKGVAFGDSFEKDYYYSSEKSSVLNRQNILHLEYGGFENEIANKIQ